MKVYGPTCIVAAAALAICTDCSGDDNSGADCSVECSVDSGNDSEATAPGDAGPATLTMLTAANAFNAIFDSVPDPNGTKVYFTAIDSSGNIGVFSVPSAGGAATPVATGTPFVAPFGIVTSTDGTTLYVTDPGVNGGNDLGQIFSLSAGGGTAAAIPGTTDLLARGITIVSPNNIDSLVFTGFDKATGAQGVFEIAAAGGTATTLADGAPFVDPSGVTTDTNGNVYVVDTIGAVSNLAAIIKVDNKGATSTFATDLLVGYPAGIALTSDGASLLVSGLDAVSGPDHIASYPIGGGASSPYVGGFGKLGNAAGLHRAAKVNVFSFVDSAGDGTDAVYLIK